MKLNINYFYIDFFSGFYIVKFINSFWEIYISVFSIISGKFSYFL